MVDREVGYKIPAMESSWCEGTGRGIKRELRCRFLSRGQPSQAVHASKPHAFRNYSNRQDNCRVRTEVAVGSLCILLVPLDNPHVGPQHQF